MATAIPFREKSFGNNLFDANGGIVQWYIDICYKNSIENNVPYLDDLYLDIVLLPTGEVIVKDADELEDAFSNEMIDKSLYDLAWEELNHLKALITNNHFELIKLSNQHKDILIDRLN